MISLDMTSVLDCTTLLPGPYCTMVLAELGAEVIKVERPGKGDLMRDMFPECFRYINGHKKLITLDLKQEEGRNILLRLAKKVHVFIEGFRPGVATELGINFDALKKVNPSIIYCSISGYGQDGPYADLPGHDINYQGLSGLLSISGDPESGPEFPCGFPVADLSGPMFALISILAALLRPDNRSTAVYLDISIAESLGMWMIPRFLEFIGQGRPPKAEFMGRGPYGIFETRDRKYLTLGVVEDHFWINLCKALGLDDLASDKTFNSWQSRNMNRGRIVQRLKDAFKEDDLESWIVKLREMNVPVAPVLDFNNWMDDPQFVHRGFIPKTEKGTVDLGKLRRFPITWLSRKPVDKEQPPTLGRDNGTVLQEVGVDNIQILKEKGII